SSNGHHATIWGGTSGSPGRAAHSTPSGVQIGRTPQPARKPSSVGGVGLLLIAAISSTVRARRNTITSSTSPENTGFAEPTKKCTSFRMLPTGIASPSSSPGTPAPSTYNLTPCGTPEHDAMSRAITTATWCHPLSSLQGSVNLKLLFVS